MLTAKSGEQDELFGFNNGADEYITKPFSPKILVARVEALLRRSNVSDMEPRLEIGGIILDKNAHTVMIDDKMIDLSFKEFELLAYYMENVGIALSRDKNLRYSKLESHEKECELSNENEVIIGSDDIVYACRRV